MIKTYCVCDRCGKKLSNDNHQKITLDCRYLDCCEDCFNIISEYKNKVDDLIKWYREKLDSLNLEYGINEIGSDTNVKD